MITFSVFVEVLFLVIVLSSPSSSQGRERRLFSLSKPGSIFSNTLVSRLRKTMSCFITAAKRPPF